MFMSKLLTWPQRSNLQGVVYSTRECRFLIHTLICPSVMFGSYFSYLGLTTDSLRVSVQRSCIKLRELLRELE